MAVVDSTWSPSSWRDFEALQQPEWPDAVEADRVRQRLHSLPPLVFAGEARQVRTALAEVAGGRAFLLQAGDCAESFHDFSRLTETGAAYSAVAIRERLKILLQMAAVLTYGAALPVLKIGRIAGQFVKPRSSTSERTALGEIPVFRGHMIHDDAATAEARIPDPGRMVEGYHLSTATLNLVRAFTKGGFADLTQVHAWNQDFVARSPQGEQYEALASEVERALGFMAACGIDLAATPQLHQVDVWTSHEGLLLDYEEGLTRRDSFTGDWYDCSAHMLWIGERTRALDGAHVEFFSGVHNPLGVKLGPKTTPDEAVELCEKLNPTGIPGRMTLIARLGAERVDELLPPLLAAVRESGHPVVWVCDPMHGNGFTTAGGRKTRHFDAIMAEIEGFFRACRAGGVWPGGVHLEYTGDNVTECLGGSEGLEEEHLDARYETLCDPRLNGRQSLDLAFRLAELMRRP
ncbi:MAG TPA: 3-deoxy-7-phosphoheptulonate synthase class II [Gaiellaceae bacterium]|jgi:3-deoxy-7-phosphoheptulonate synthase|nr:3-deoxy-7-phosphoheptulonate synthase class II [Gaiellaceae bacterium]